MNFVHYYMCTVGFQASVMEAFLQLVFKSYHYDLHLSSHGSKLILMNSSKPIKSTSNLNITKNVRHLEL